MGGGWSAKQEEVREFLNKLFLISKQIVEGISLDLIVYYLISDENCEIVVVRVLDYEQEEKRRWGSLFGLFLFIFSCKNFMN